MKTEILKVDPNFPDSKKIAKCANIIRQGGIVIFPTETVYGLAADNSNLQAMKSLRQLKNRSAEKPFSVLVSQKGLISNYSSIADSTVYKLIDAYWPGPLTVVVPSKEKNKTIGIRMPDHPIALKLVKESQCTIAAPSANIEGGLPPATCEDALKDYDGLVDIAIDGGQAKYGTGSSVVDLTQEKPVVIRKGVITQEDVDNIAKKKSVLFVCTGNSCRSVMAEYLMKDMTKDRDNVHVASAGTGVFIHSTASAETLSVLGQNGISAQEHLSQPITSILLKSSDLIFVMTRAHRQAVLERAPEVEKRVYLLREFVNTPASFQSDLDIPDPIGKSHGQYEECLEVIKEAIYKLVELV